MLFADVQLNARVRLAASRELPAGGVGVVVARYAVSRRLDVRLDDGSLQTVPVDQVESRLEAEREQQTGTELSVSAEQAL